MHIHINITANRAVQILLIYLFFVVASGGLFVPIFAIFVTDFLPGATLKTVGFALGLYAVRCIQLRKEGIECFPHFLVDEWFDDIEAQVFQCGDDRIFEGLRSLIMKPLKNLRDWPK